MTRSLLFFAFIPLLLTAAVGGADKPKGLSTESPFAPAGTTAAPGAVANETIEFAGVTTIGKRTDLIFYDKVAKQNHWIAPGEAKAGIALMNYDPQREQAVVKVNGVEKVLTLRKGHGPVGAGHIVTPVPTGFNTPTPSPAAVPITATAPGAPVQPQPTPAAAPSGPVTPATQARQETEARMLVSDLLEIGMAQRKAYEEAQRKAADGTAPVPPPPEAAKQP